MVAGRGRMPPELGVVHTPCGAGAMASVLTGISLPVMFIMWLDRDEGISLR